MRPLMQRLHAGLRTRFVCRKGQTLVEYSLILSIIGLVFIAVFKMLGNQLVITFSAITTLLDSAPSSGF